MSIVIGTTNRYGKHTVASTSYDVLVTPMDSPIQHRRLRAPNPSRAWHIVLPVSAKAEVTAILTEFNNSVGGCGETQFTPPGAVSSVQARFASPSLTYRQTSASNYEIEYDIVEDVVFVHHDGSDAFYTDGGEWEVVVDEV